MRTSLNNCGCHSLWQNSINEHRIKYSNTCSIFNTWRGACGCNFNNFLYPNFGNFITGFSGLCNTFLGFNTGILLGVGLFSLFGFQNNKNANNIKNDSLDNKYLSNDNKRPKVYEPIIKNNEDNSLDHKVRDEMIYIANDAMEKYLKTGKFEITDLLIERVNAEITNIDFTDRFNMKSGVSNDYKNADGKNVLVSDGTKVTLTFKYNNKEYQCIVRSDEIPANTKPKEQIEE